MDLKDKLSRYHKKLDSESHAEISATNESLSSRIPSHWHQLAEITDGEIRAYKNGYYYYRQKKYHFFDEPYVRELADDFMNIRSLSKIMPEIEGVDLSFKELLFFDLETSGISGGAGTVAFLIGGAQVDEEAVTVYQWILPDFSHEHLILHEFHQFVQGFKGIVSFNGKTFDVPVIKNRYRLNRLEEEVDDLIHLDLLHPARRLWKKRLGSCKLQNLEKHILQIYRQEDIPGELIPSVFFNFLYGEGLDEFKIILEHNFLDLVNLVKVGLYMESGLRNPATSISDPKDVESLCLYLEKQKKWEEIHSFVPDFLERNDDNVRLTSIYARICKRSGLIEEAAQYYKKLFFEYKTYSFDDLKHYLVILENKLKDYNTAIIVIDKMLDKLSIKNELYGGKFRQQIIFLKDKKKKILKKLEK
ncbi:MAG: metal-dependent exonucleaseMrfB [Calditrichia bacterium]